MNKLFYPTKQLIMLCALFLVMLINYKSNAQVYLDSGVKLPSINDKYREAANEARKAAQKTLCPERKNWYLKMAAGLEGMSKGLSMPDLPPVPPCPADGTGGSGKSTQGNTNGRNTLGSTNTLNNSPRNNVDAVTNSMQNTYNNAKNNGVSEADAILQSFLSGAEAAEDKKTKDALAGAGLVLGGLTALIEKNKEKKRTKAATLQEPNNKQSLNSLERGQSSNTNIKRFEQNQNSSTEDLTARRTTNGAESEQSANSNIKRRGDFSPNIFIINFSYTKLLSPMVAGNIQVPAINSEQNHNFSFIVGQLKRRGVSFFSFAHFLKQNNNSFSFNAMSTSGNRQDFKGAFSTSGNQLGIIIGKDFWIADGKFHLFVGPSASYLNFTNHLFTYSNGTKTFQDSDFKSDHFLVGINAQAYLFIGNRFALNAGYFSNMFITKPKEDLYYHQSAFSTFNVGISLKIN